MQNTSEDVRFQELHKHYRDTFRIIREEIKRRDKLLIMVLVALAVSAMATFGQPMFVDTFLQIFSEKFFNATFDISSLFSGGAVGSIIAWTMVLLGFDPSLLGGVAGFIVWAILLIVTTKYAQAVVYIERQYKYIHLIEEELNKHYEKESNEENIVFTREGKSYLEEYPAFLTFVDCSYKIIIPAILVTVITLNIIREWVPLIQENQTLLLSYLKTILGVLVLIFILLYIKFLIDQRREQSKQNRQKREQSEKNHAGRK